MEAKQMTAAILAVVMAIAAGGGGLLVGAQPSCAAKLTQCGDYLSSNNTTTPPETCCGPLRDEVTNDMACLCAILQNPSISMAFGINTTNAFRLARSCGVNNMNGCSPAPTPSLTPPGSPGGGNNAAAPHKMSSVGLTGFLLLLWFTVA